MLTFPSHTLWAWLAPLLVAAALALLITPVVKRVAMVGGVLDRPVGGKIHTRPTPLLGGVGVYLAFVVAGFLFLPPSAPLIGLAVGGGIAVAVGVVDDKFALSPVTHFLGQVLAAAATIVTGIGVVRYVSIPWAPANYHGSWHVPLLIGILFTMFWIVGMMNTVNFLDGLDGLSSGVGAIAALLLAAWAANPQRFIAHPTGQSYHTVLVLSLVVAGALLGFLPYNWHPARIFIGDPGAMFVGVALAALSVIGPAKIGTALLVLIIPVLDVAWAIARRQLRGRSFLTGDKQHVYHRMRDLGVPYIPTVLSLYALCAVLGVLDLELAKLQKLIAFAALAVAVGAAFIALEVAGSKRRPPARDPRAPHSYQTTTTGR